MTYLKRSKFVGWRWPPGTFVRTWTDRRTPDLEAWGVRVQLMQQVSVETRPASRHSFESPSRRRHRVCWRIWLPATRLATVHFCNNNYNINILLILCTNSRRHTHSHSVIISYNTYILLCYDNLIQILYRYNNYTRWRRVIFYFGRVTRLIYVAPNVHGSVNRKSSISSNKSKRDLCMWEKSRYFCVSALYISFNAKALISDSSKSCTRVDCIITMFLLEPLNVSRETPVSWTFRKF